MSLDAKPAGPRLTEADRLAIALANLMNAIMSGRLPNACLVISDLAGAWGDGSLRIQQAIDNAKQEVGRGALDITPVRLDSTELYAILRSRLFEQVPGDTERRVVCTSVLAGLPYRCSAGRDAEVIRALGPGDPGKLSLPPRSS